MSNLSSLWIYNTLLYKIVRFHYWFIHLLLTNFIYILLRKKNEWNLKYYVSSNWGGLTSPRQRNKHRPDGKYISKIERNLHWNQNLRDDFGNRAQNQTHTHPESLWYIPKNVKQANKQDISKCKLTSSIIAVITLSVYCEQCSLGE